MSRLMNARNEMEYEEELEACLTTRLIIVENNQITYDESDTCPEAEGGNPDIILLGEQGMTEPVYDIICHALANKLYARLHFGQNTMMIHNLSEAKLACDALDMVVGS